MSARLRAAPAITVAVRQVVIRAGSAIDARRLGDALLPAISSALEAARNGAASPASPRGAADRVAHAVRQALVERLEGHA